MMLTSALSSMPMTLLAPMPPASLVPGSCFSSARAPLWLFRQLHSSLFLLLSLPAHVVVLSAWFDITPYHVARSFSVFRCSSIHRAMDTPSRPPLHIHPLPSPLHPFATVAKPPPPIPLHPNPYALGRIHTSSPTSPAPTTDALYASLYPTALPSTHNNFAYLPQPAPYAIPAAYTWLPPTTHSPLQPQFISNAYAPSPTTPAPPPAVDTFLSRPVLARSTDSLDQIDTSGFSQNYQLSALDHAQGQPYRCEYCDKVYTGKHARSIWRRHLSDKHQIPLSSQPRRTRWDNADSNRPKTEEERRARTLESKRRWARKNRAEKKTIRQAGFAVPKSAKDISQLAVQLGFVEGNYGDGSESGSESEDDGPMSVGKSSFTKSKSRKREGGSDGGFDLEHCISSSSASHLAVPEAPPMFRTSSAPSVMGKSQHSTCGPLQIRVPSPSTLTVPALRSAASAGTCTSVCEVLQKRCQDNWDSSSDIDAEDEDGREAGDALVALKRSAAKPMASGNRWTDYEIPLRDSTSEKRASRPASRMSLVSGSAPEEDGDEGPSFASSSGSAGLTGASFGLDRAGDSSPCTSPDGSVAGKSFGSKVKREWMVDDDHEAITSSNWTIGQKRSKVSHQTEDETSAGEGDDVAVADYSNFFGAAFPGQSSNVTMETPARPPATRPKPSPGLGDDHDDVQLELGHVGTGFSSPVINLGLSRQTQANYGYGPQLTAHKPRLGASGMRCDASEDEADLSSCGQPGSSSGTSWASLRTPGLGKFADATGFPFGSSPALHLGLSSIRTGSHATRPLSGGSGTVVGVKQEGDTSTNLFSSPAHANFSRSLGLAPVGGYGSGMDDVLMRIEPLGTPAHALSKARESR